MPICGKCLKDTCGQPIHFCDKKEKYKEPIKLEDVPGFLGTVEERNKQHTQMEIYWWEKIFGL